MFRQPSSPRFLAGNGAMGYRSYYKETSRDEYHYYNYYEPTSKTLNPKPKTLNPKVAYQTD